MLALKYLLMILGAGLFGSAGALVVYDVFLPRSFANCCAVLPRTKPVGRWERWRITLLLGVFRRHGRITLVPACPKMATDPQGAWTMCMPDTKYRAARPRSGLTRARRPSGSPHTVL